jgi:hypothetical protein
MAVHVVEADREPQFGRDQPADRGGYVELGDRRVVLCGNQLGFWIASPMLFSEEPATWMIL